MEKKDLRERLVDIMHYDGTYSTSDLVKFIQQELDRAREEGFKVGYAKGSNNDDLQMTYEWVKDVDTSKWI